MPIKCTGVSSILTLQANGITSWAMLLTKQLMHSCKRARACDHKKLSIHAMSKTSRMYNSKDGRKLISDAKGHVSGHGCKERTINAQLNSLRKQQKTNSWRTHQSIPCLDHGKCAYKGCPNLRLSTGKKKRSYDTYMKCEKYSVIAKSSVYFCNNKKDGKVVNCHLCYHQKFES